MTSIRAVLIGVVLCSVAIFAQSTNPVPTTTQPLSPAASPPTTSGLQLLINGTGFVPGSIVSWDGIELPTTFLSPNRLAAEVSAAFVASARTAYVKVTNPGPGGGPSNAIAFSVSSSADSLNFSTLTYPLEFSPNTLVVADFNRDGHPDIAVIQCGDGPRCPDGVTVSILLGKGDGTFTRGTTLTFGLPSYTFSEGAAAGDFNRDGKLDLAISYRGKETGVVILLGGGDGTFTPKTRDGESLDGSAGDQFSAGGESDLASPIFAGREQDVLLAHIKGQIDTPLGCSTYFLRPSRAPIRWWQAISITMAFSMSLPSLAPI